MGREGGSYYLEQWMYVWGGGRDPSFKIYNGIRAMTKNYFVGRGGEEEEQGRKNGRRKSEK